MLACMCSNGARQETFRAVQPCRMKPAPAPRGAGSPNGSGEKNGVSPCDGLDRCGRPFWFPPNLRLSAEAATVIDACRSTVLLRGCHPLSIQEQQQLCKDKQFNCCCRGRFFFEPLVALGKPCQPLPCNSMPNLCRRIMEEDADFDEDVAAVLEGADGDPEKIRANVRCLIRVR